MSKIFHCVKGVSKPIQGMMILGSVQENLMTVMFAGNSYKFDRIGSEYNAQVPVLALRAVPALCGSLLVPASYFLILELGCQQWTAVLASFFILAGNAQTFIVFRGFGTCFACSLSGIFEFA